MRIDAGFWRGRATHTREASAVVATWEAAIVELAELREPTPELKLAELLAKKNLKAAEVTAKWDSDGGGVNEQEFITNLRKLNIDLADEELKGVFAAFDKTGDGELEHEELKAAFRSLGELTTKTQDKERKLKKLLATKEAEAREAQQGVKKELDADAKRKEDQETAAKEAAEAAAAVAAAKEAELAAKKAAKRAQEEAEKAAFDEKVKARRAGMMRQNTMMIPPGSSQSNEGAMDIT